ncbi:endonuclease/exonuclease/phosphatase family protein [Ornithinicoccus hortensis]|uniref:Endonuclease/exonuclease/phosphatase family metal-dependent hydrolase n=1 Tax=Ornithinicoccus hortensis TaxID=82346 RepID=A0A542YR99_9MICO|nr:endonuclease/exonuclease/phosphatase family protein [Ornithinicoccus hortensis]TQL50635.1 endonuclease/exonuclease/phosphatase family metal-dependent hydrolase [Ornithinicoccus hortensis]
MTTDPNQGPEPAPTAELPGGETSDSPREEASPTLRVASYNLRALQDDVGAAAAVVRAIDPDVLLLQEVPRYPGSSYKIADFARRCDLLWSGRTRLVSGTAIMTSLRVIATDSTDRALPVKRGRGKRSLNPRCYTVAQVKRPGGRDATVVSVHLPLFPDERLIHTRLVLAELAKNPRLADGPFVVGGDFNESTDGEAWHLLGERLRLVSAEEPTFPSSRPRTFIDAVFASTEIAEELVHRPVELDPTVLAAATDHRPVWADLRI